MVKADTMECIGFKQDTRAATCESQLELQSQVVLQRQRAVSALCSGLVNNINDHTPNANCCQGTLNGFTGDLRAAVI